jgi:hypothetical protein
LENAVKNIIILQGGMGVKQRKAVMNRLFTIPENEERVLIATGRYIGEGFDDARLDTLFLALPISWKGTVQQYVGRLHRLHDQKREVVVYDYVEGCVPMMAAMFDKLRMTEGNCTGARTCAGYLSRSHIQLGNEGEWNQPALCTMAHCFSCAFC